MLTLYPLYAQAQHILQAIACISAAIQETQHELYGFCLQGYAVNLSIQAIGKQSNSFTLTRVPFSEHWISVYDVQPEIARVIQQEHLPAGVLSLQKSTAAAEAAKHRSR